MPPSDEERPQERSGALLSPAPPQPSPPADPASAESQPPAESPSAQQSPGEQHPPQQPSAQQPSGQQPPAQPSRAQHRPAGPGRPPKPRAAAGRPLQQQASAALFLALLSLFGLLAISNVNRGAVVAGFALAAGALAVWFAATSIRRARRQHTALPRGSVIALVIAGIGMAISIVLLAGFAMFGKQVSAYSRCLSGANTIVAENTCHSQFMNSLTGTASGLRSGSHG